MNISEFLLARIAEDEAQAQYTRRYGSSGPLELFSPVRTLAECKAKRAIIASCLANGISSQVLPILAAIYAEHPDYNQEWKL